MVLHELRNADGEVFAFEIDHIGRGKAVRIIRQIPGVRLIRKPALFSFLREEDFCEFEIGGIRFLASEPFGDNSRLWIGPKDESNVAHPDFEHVKNAFRRSEP
jgi:hypothetical protein